MKRSDYSKESSKNTQIRDGGLPINKLCAVFFNSSSTNKFFWFISILQLCRRNKIKMDYEVLKIRMIANAWHLIINHNLSLGYNDQLYKTVLSLQKHILIDKDNSVDEIIDILNIQKKEKNISRYMLFLPWLFTYEFLCTFFDDINSYNLSERLKNKKSGCIYSVYEDWQGSYIVIDAKWKEFLVENYWALLDFTYKQLASYIKLKNRQIFDLMPLLREEGGISNSVLEKISVNESICYTLNTAKRCYVFNSLYDVIFSSNGKVLTLNNDIYKLFIGSDYFLVYIVEKVNANKMVINKPIISAYENSPLYSIYNKKIDPYEIKSIRKNSENKFEINIHGVWYDNKGYSIIDRNSSITSDVKRKIKPKDVIIEQIGSKNTVTKMKSSLLGRYVRLYPSYVVGKITVIKETSEGERKFEISTLEGGKILIYDNPYTYKLLSPSQVKRIIKA